MHQLNRPLKVNGQRTSALRTTDQRVLALWHILVWFRLLACGFSNHDLREQVAVLTGLTPTTISQGRMTYDLRRLRLHGMIERIPKTHRYRVTPFGLRVALFLHPSPCPPLPSQRHPIQRQCSSPQLSSRPAVPKARKRNPHLCPGGSFGCLKLDSITSSSQIQGS